MKKIKYLLPLLLIALLLMGLLPLGAFAQEGASTDSAESAPTPAAPGDIVSSGSSPEEAPPPAETAAPTATPATTPTAAPTETPAPTTEPSPLPTEIPKEVPTTLPQSTPSPSSSPEPTTTPVPPTTIPEIEPSGTAGPNSDEPYGDGIVMGPNNPPEGAPMILASNNGNATIAVRSCTDSSGNEIKYVGYFYCDGRWVGGNNYPRHILYANNDIAYCLEPGKPLAGGNTVTIDAASAWNSFSKSKQNAIKIALLCGQPGNSKSLSGSMGSQYTATALVIWEFVMDLRNTSSPYTVTDNKVINSVCANGANSEVKTVYDQISSAMAAYNTLPSFANSLQAPPPQNNLQYNNGTYSLTLTDTNNVLGNYNVTCTDSSVKLSISGNKLTMTSTTYVSGATVNLTRKNTISASSQIVAYAGSGLQETVIGIEAVSGTPGYFSIKSAYIPKGSAKIVKTSSDGKVAGITFTVTGPGVNTTVTTGSDGTFTLNDLTPGTYTVTETVPAGYTADKVSQTVTVADKQTGTVTFKNALKTGNVKIVKTSDDGKVSGIQFTVKGGSVDQTVASGSDGTITVPGLVPGQYAVTEQVPESYVCDNPSQTVTVVYDQTAEVHFENKLKMWRVAVTKVDAEAGVRRSSGATLVGAVYGIYKDGALLDSYTIDESDQFVTKLYPCGTGYELKEITPPTGYTVDPNSYPIGAEPGTVELAANDTAITVKETIIKGKLLIVKQDALTETPLAGAVFSVMDETGATVTEATTGEDGTFTVEELPYGKYTAKETTPPDGYQLDETVFDFAIETDGQTVTLTRDNIYCVGSITVHKVDTQGSALSGTAYLLEWSEDGSTWEPVVFREGTTPTIGGCTSLGLESGQLTTGEDGSILFDGLVANGKVYYRLTETKTQPGLSLLKDPVFQGTLPLDGETDKEYDISYTVTNNRITTLPQTGGSGLLLPVTIGMALLGMAGCTGFFVARSKKAKSGKEN